MSYPLHGRQRTDKNVCRRPAYSIRASEGRRLRASPRYSPVSSLPHPLPPSAVGAVRCVKLERGKHGQYPVEPFTIRPKSQARQPQKATKEQFVQNKLRATCEKIFEFLFFLRIRSKFRKLTQSGIEQTFISVYFKILVHVLLFNMQKTLAYQTSGFMIQITRLQMIYRTSFSLRVPIKICTLPLGCMIGILKMLCW